MLPILLAACGGVAASPAAGTPAVVASPAATLAPGGTLPASLAPATAPTPAATGPESAAPTATPAPTRVPAATASPAATTIPSPTPPASPSPAQGSPAPTPGPGGWITLPGNQGLLGLAGNGDVFVSVGRPGRTPEIRRLSPRGEILATVTWDERALKSGANRWLVDPTDDSLVGFQYNPGRVTRMSLKTGRVVRTFRTPDRMGSPAIDGKGRIHLVCESYGAGTCSDIAGAGAVIVYDRNGKRLAGRQLLTEKNCTFADPAILARTTGGTIRALSTGFGTGESPCAGSKIRAVDLTAGLRLGRSYTIPYERGYIVNWLDSIDVRDMAGAPGGRTLLVETAKKNGHPVEYKVGDLLLFRQRLREIGPDGRVLRTWGYGGTNPGVDNPIEVELASDGTIWVLDSDAVARKAYTRYLPPSP
jgi:hypothetical protein